ncbi:MAG: hypothetical protein ABI741_08575 [Ferruginibacter sp.]
MPFPGWIIQIQWLCTLAIPVACISWTITHEEVFKEPRDFCIRCSKEGQSLFIRKFFYLFTCEYCFSHYVTIGIILLTGFRLLFENWKGYIIGGFSMVWIANMYMAIFSLLRFGVKKEKMEIRTQEEELKTLSNKSLRQIPGREAKRVPAKVSRV